MAHADAQLVRGQKGTAEAKPGTREGDHTETALGKRIKELTCLYRAKQAGRNRVAIADSTEGVPAHDSSR